jgi:hypothetical protein
MDHIINKIIDLSSIPILSDGDQTTGVSIIEQLEKICQWKKVPSCMIGTQARTQADECAQMKIEGNAFERMQYYYAIVYMEGYKDRYDQNHVSRVIFVPFGYWRYHPIGIGVYCEQVHWEAFGWNTQMHRQYSCYDELSTLPTNEREKGRVAYGYGEGFTETAAFPVDKVISRSIGNWFIITKWYIRDVVVASVRGITLTPFDVE